MNINNILMLLRDRAKTGFDVYERRPGKYQLIVPVLHEDGDMVDIYIQDSPNGKDYIRICDYGMTLMRLSYVYEVNTKTRQKIFESILINNGIEYLNGNLWLDSPVNLLYENILQFSGCVQKVCNMRYWSQEITRTAFYDDLGEYTTTNLSQFEPVPDQSPLDNYQIISVDWSLTCNKRNLYLFGVRGNDKAKSTAISLLEFQKSKLPFISLIVHEDMEALGKKEKLYLTKNADTQYPNLDDFREKAPSDIIRLAA